MKTLFSKLHSQYSWLFNHCLVGSYEKKEDGKEILKDIPIKLGKKRLQHAKTSKVKLYEDRNY